MAFTLRVDGHRNLGSVRQALRDVGDRDLSRMMSRGFQRAAKPLKPAIQASALRVLPKAGGYAELMAQSVRVRTAVRERSGFATVTITVYGDGKAEKRDVPRINKGTLRHPVYGRRRKAWVDQKVRRGFVDRPVDGLSPDIAREMRAIVDWVGDQIKRG